MSNSGLQVRTTRQDTRSGSHGVDAAELVRRLEITHEDLDAVRAYGKIVVPQLDAYNTLFYQWMERQPEWSIFFSDAALRDHFSSGGSLGLGLPGIGRMMTSLEVSSEVGVGTRVSTERLCLLRAGLR